MISLQEKRTVDTLQRNVEHCDQMDILQRNV
jgi:hypothetical protein